MVAIAILFGALAAALAVAQQVVSPQELAALKQSLREADPQAPAGAPAAAVVRDGGIASLEQPGIPVEEDGGLRVVDLYTGLQSVGNGFWSYGEVVSSVLDDGKIGPAAAAAGGGRVTAYQFAFGVHGDFAGDIVRPYVIVTFYNAPVDPVADATNPVVEPPAPVSSVAWLFTPITLPTAGDFGFQSSLINLASFGLDFDLDEVFYVEILPMEWSAYPSGGPVFDPDVHAVFTGPGALSYGENQDRMWIDTFNPSLMWGDGDGLYDHPAELEIGAGSPLLNRSGIRLRGDTCPSPNVLSLDIDHPADECVQPGEPVTLTLSQSCLPGLVRGYQAFLEHDPARLVFGSGAYVTPVPFGLPILTPITAIGPNIDLAAGINDPGGQMPTSSSADLATLSFTAGAVEGLANVDFRAHDPPTRFSDPMGIGVTPALVNSPGICIDGTPPMISCPPDLSVQCPVGIPSIADDYGELVAQGGAASDSGCGPGVGVSHMGDVKNAGLGCPLSEFVILRTYRATDCAGNFAECTQQITVNDNTLPVISGCPSNMVQANDPGDCGAVVAWTPPTASDNCGTPLLVQTAGPAPGSFFAVGGPYSIAYTATDHCGNISICSFTVTVHDAEPPNLTCPANINTNAEAGGCTASIAVPPPMVNDNCGVLGVVNSLNGTGDASGVYSSGMTEVAWTATDVNGNSDECLQTVTVNPFNELAVSLQLSPTMVAGPIDRCITFEFWDCTTNGPAAVEMELLEFSSGLASAKVLIECGAYECITARDELHTLRRTDEEFAIVGTEYVADFTGDASSGGDWLIGGNLNDDLWIDTLDFGVFSSQFAVNYGTGAATCATASPHADVNGNGLVFSEDFTFIQINFLQSSEANCCGQPGRGGSEAGGGPLTRVSVAELRSCGLGRLAAGDLNRDGWLDESDMAAFLMGMRPASHGAIAPAEKIQH